MPIMRAHAPPCARIERLLLRLRSSWCPSGRRRAMRRSGSITRVMGPLTWTVHEPGLPVKINRSPCSAGLLGTLEPFQQFSACQSVYVLCRVLKCKSPILLLPWPSTHAVPRACRRAEQQQGAAEVCAGGVPVVRDAPDRGHAGALHGQRPPAAQGAPQAAWRASSTAALFARVQQQP